MHIAFDLGNVLFHVDFKPFYDQCDLMGFRRRDVDLLVRTSDYLDFTGVLRFSHALERFYVDNYYNSTSIEHDMRSLMTAWNDCVYIDDDMARFVENLHSDGVKIALLSNIGKDHASTIEEKYTQFFKHIYYRHYSFECGAAKPTKLFFQSFLLDKPEFTGCVFLDDKIENVKSAANYNFIARQFDIEKFTNKASLKRYLKDLREQLLSSQPSEIG